MKKTVIHPGIDRKRRAAWLLEQTKTAPDKEAFELYGRGLTLLSAPNESDWILAVACLRRASVSIPLARRLLESCHR